MTHYTITLMYKSGQEEFFLVKSNKNLYKEFKRKMQSKDDYFLGLKTVSNKKLILNVKEIVSLQIEEEKEN